MTAEERATLRKWCRYAKVDDTKDDGICVFTLKFRIRDEDMVKVARSMTYDDAVSVASEILSSVCDGCEDYWEDWIDSENECFVMDTWTEGGFIVMAGRYRT